MAERCINDGKADLANLSPEGSDTRQALDILTTAMRTGASDVARRAWLYLTAAVQAPDPRKDKYALAARLHVDLLSGDLELARERLQRCKEDPSVRQVLSQLRGIQDSFGPFAREIRQAGIAHARILAQGGRVKHAAGPVVAVYLPASLLRPKESPAISRVFENVRKAYAAVLLSVRAEGLPLQVIISGERMTTGNAPACAFAVSHHSHGKGERRLHIKEGDVHGLMCMDPLGYSGWSSMATLRGVWNRIPDAEADRHAASVIERMRDSHASKYIQRFDPHLDLPPRFVFVALQMMSDSVQALADIPMLDMLRLVVERFGGTGVTVLVKRHPLCASSRVRAALDDCAKERHVRITDASIHQLLPRCEAVFTVNSGVGSEALAYAKPVYTFGGCDYRAATHAIRSRADFMALCAEVGPAMPVAELTRFFCYYRTRYLVDIDDPCRLERALRERLLEPARSALARFHEPRHMGVA